MVKFRLYYDKDKEEIWLNKMAQEGYAMTRFFLGFYWFEACEKGEYVYQIDLFTEPKQSMTHAEYVNLITETGAEFMGSWGWWRFFRRKAELGEFKLYTDASSRLEQLQRIFRFFRNVLILEAVVLVYEIAVTGINLYHGYALTGVMLSCCILIGALTAVIGTVCCSTRKKIRELEKELV